MTIRSVGYDGSVGEADWAAYLAEGLGGPPTVTRPNDFRVNATTGMQVQVAPGTASGWGITDLSDAAESIQIEAVSSGTRYDAVVLRRDWAGTSTTPTGAASGGRTYIHTDLTIQCDIKVFHSFFKFQPTAAYIRKSVSSDLNLYSLREHGSRLIFFLTINIYIACHDECLCFLAGWCKGTFHHKHIQTFLHCSLNSSLSSIACLMSSTPSPIRLRRLSTFPWGTKRSQTAADNTLISG